MCCNKFHIPLRNKHRCFSNQASCNEQGRTFAINKPKGNRENFCRIKIGECLIVDQKQCDYVFIRCKREVFYFVELKRGSNVLKAFAQIVETIRYFKKRIEIPKDSIYGYIACRSIPGAIRNDWRNKKIEFRRDWGMDLDNREVIEIE